MTRGNPHKSHTSEVEVKSDDCQLDAAFSLGACGLIQGGGRSVARVGVNRGIIARHAPLNCRPHCGDGVGRQLQTGLEQPAHNNGAAVLLFFFFLRPSICSALTTRLTAQNHAKSMLHATLNRKLCVCVYVFH